MAGLSIYIDDKDLKKAQKGDAVKNAEDVINFMKDYYSSPAFIDRVNRENDNLNRHNRIGPEGYEKGYSEGHYNINPNSIPPEGYKYRLNEDLPARRSYYTPTTKTSTIGIKDNPEANFLAHELAHGSPFWNTKFKGDDFNIDDLKNSPYYHNDFRRTGSWKYKLQPKEYSSLSHHDRDLAESYSDLMALRYWLQKKGYFDNMNPDDVMTKDRMYDILEKDGVIFDTDKKGNKIYKGFNGKEEIPFDVRRFLFNHEPDNIIDAINDVAVNDTSELVKAQLGGWIKKAYRWITDEDARNAPTYDSGTFEEAFADAKKKGVKTFYWNNDYYNTNEKYYDNAPVMDGNTFAQAYNNAKEHWGFQNAINRDYEGLNETRNMFNWNGKTYKVPEETVKDKYERITGLGWDTARKYGFTDGSYKQNMLLNNGLDDIDLHGMEYDNIELPEDGKIKDRPDLFAKLYATYLGNKFYEDTQGKNEQRWKLPVDMNKTITLTKAGKNTGTKVPVDLLDYIMESAEKTNTPLEIAFGLPAQESAFGLNDAKGKRNVFIDQGNGDTFIDLIGLYSNWAYSNDNPAYGYVNSKNAKADNFKYSINIDDFLNRIEERKNTEIPIHAYGLYSTGNYNSLDKSHSPIVWHRGSDFINSPEFKKYLEDYKRRKNNKYQQGGPTHLQPWDEQRFRMWFNSLPEGIRNSNDYDYRGWWLENGSIPYKNGVHFTDKFKLPNHPTFSEESIYSKGNTEGGYWTKDGFVPSPYNTRNGSDRIIDYMEFAEPKGTKMYDTNGMVVTFQNGGPKRRLKDNFNKFTKEELDFISNNWNTGQTFTDGQFVYVMPGDTASNLHNRNVKQTLFDNGLPRSNASMVSTSNGWKISHAMDERYAGNEGRSWDNFIVKYYIGDNKDLIPQNAQYITVDENGNYVLNNGVPRLSNGGQTGLSIFIDDEQFKKGGQIHIKEKNKGKFTAKAKAAGMSVQEFARKVLSDKNKNKYSASTRRQANFARNASKWGK